MISSFAAFPPPMLGSGSEYHPQQLSDCATRPWRQISPARALGEVSTAGAESSWKGERWATQWPPKIGMIEDLLENYPR